MRHKVIQPTAARYRVTQGGQTLTLTTASRRRWFIVIVNALFFAVAAVFILPIGLVTIWLLGFGSAREFQALQPSQWAFLIFFSLLWVGWGAANALRALYTVLWNLAGREVIEVGSSFIRLSHRIPGWSRGREYQAADIRELRVSPQLVTEWSLNQMGMLWPHAVPGQVAFDYGAKTIRFADVDEAEAKMMLAEIQQRFEQYR